FESGMAAITTTLLTHLRPGDVVLHSQPLYGGTDHLIRTVLPMYGITGVGFDAAATEDEMLAAAERAPGRVAMIYLETPANPTNALCDIAACADVARRLGGTDRRVPVVVDNTYLGPLWQRPLEHG